MALSPSAAVAAPVMMLLRANARVVACNVQKANAAAWSGSLWKCKALDRLQTRREYVMKVLVDCALPPNSRQWAIHQRRCRYEYELVREANLLSRERTL
mmetsp:Transcript_35295/g.77310  ORF Transcript_35295/g.77310 Transcript_35295/m.77310 type:complete len:99 (+) Transcript_35295:2157-2453(+)